MHRHTSSLLLILGLAATALPRAGAEDKAPRATPPGQTHEHAAQQPAGSMAQQAAASLRRLKEGNERFAGGKTVTRVLDVATRARLAQGQQPMAAILACADSRVPPEFLFDQSLGDLFVIRVAGNVTSTGALGSLEYAVEHLKVPLIVVVGHTNCGAVRAAVEGADPDGFLGLLLRDVHIGRNLPQDRKEAVAAGVRANVLTHAGELTKRSGILQEAVRAGRVRVGQRAPR